MRPFIIHTALTLGDWRAQQQVIALRLQQRAMEPGETSPFMSPCEHAFGPEGVSSSQAGVHSVVQWGRVSDVTATDEHIFIWFDTVGAFVIPVRDLPPEITAEQVVTGIKEWMAAPAAQQPASSSFGSEAAVEVQPAPAVVANGEPAWRTVFRLLTLRSIEHPGRPADALSGKPAFILLLAIVSLALWAGLSWFYFLPEPQFYPYSAPALAWYVLAALAVAVTMAKRSHPQIPLSRVCMLLAVLLPILIVADFATVMLVPDRWIDAVRAALGLYAIVYCAQGLHALTGSRQPVAVLGGSAVAVIFLGLASALYVYPALWTAKDEYQDTADYETERDAGEALLFEQPARIDASVAQIEPASGEAPAGFFVGFAGYGDQRVFAEEIKFAARTFAKRYDTADRTLLMLNDRRDREAQPLATVTGLRYALKAVASKMRLERDVLFLALSSHGSEDPLLSVENGMLPLRDLTGDALAEALRASGIKWRVIVISACHAGAFIEPLRDPYTVVITAAAPERTSFGCSDERDLTYFGEAFFRDSLPHAASLREAFDTATKLVGEREREQGVDASHPQAFFGEHIEQRLAPMLRPAMSAP